MLFRRYRKMSKKTQQKIADYLNIIHSIPKEIEELEQQLKSHIFKLSYCEDINGYKTYKNNTNKRVQDNYKQAIKQSICELKIKLKETYKSLHKLGYQIRLETRQEKKERLAKIAEEERQASYQAFLKAKEKYGKNLFKNKEEKKDTKPFKENILDKDQEAYEYKNLKLSLIEQHGKQALLKAWKELGLKDKIIDSLLSCKAYLEEQKNHKKTVKKVTKKDVIVNNSQNLENTAKQATVSA